MKKIFSIITIMTLPVITMAQTSAFKPAVLYGAIQKTDLMKPPFDKWFDSTYAAYQPNAGTINTLSKLNTKDISIQVFMGTWCGDSKREVPRFMKTLDAISFLQKNVSIVALGDDSLYKQSPQHEEAGKGIFRVPVFIIYKNGVELNRINEFPAFSLEKDILTILSNQPYSPNYRSFATIKNWLADGVLTDKNITARSLTMQIKYFVTGERELNNLGYVLLEQGKKAEALKIFQVNANLYPESSNILSSLGEGYLKNGDTKNAVQYEERALELNKDPQQVKPILKILYEAKGLQQ